MTVDLGIIEHIPQKILSKFDRTVRILLEENEFQEQLLELSIFSETISALNEIAKKNGVVGYHYTRSIKSSIEDNGLEVRSGSEHRKIFLKEHAGKFTSEQIDRLKSGWNRYFDSQQNKVRDNRIWFNLTNSALANGGASPLLKNYGGEVIYMPFSRDIEISKILQSIGEPMIVRCSLDTQHLKTFCDDPWGKVLFSSYHRSINPDAFPVDFDVYTTFPVQPNQILSIEVVRQEEL